MKKYLTLVLKVGLSLALLLYSLQKVDIMALSVSWKHWTFTPFIIGTIIAACGVYVQAIRWKLLVGKESSTPLSLYIRYSWIGYFFNLLIPISVGGEIAKAWQMGSQVSNKGRLVATVIQAKIMGLLSLVLLGSLFGFHLLAPYWRIPLALLSFILLVISLTPFWWPKKYTTKLMKKRFFNLQEWMNGEGLRKRDYLLGLILSMLVQGLAGLVHWYFFIGVGAELSLVENFAYFPWLPLIMILPISLGGIGIKEAYSVNTLANLPGVTNNHCIESAMASYLLVLLFAGVGALVWLRQKKSLPIKTDLN